MVINVNRDKIFSGRLSVVDGIVGVSTLLVLSINMPCYGGSQSLLDPYANIQPPTSQTETKASGNGTFSKKPHSAKIAKVSENNSSVQSSKTANNVPASPGFFSGVKEIQHGYVTTFKAAGSGIINGTKSIGAKIASGGGKLKDGIGAAGNKISSGPKALVAKAPGSKKKDNAQKVAQANSNAFAAPASTPNTSMPPLPGKPLGPVAAKLSTNAKAKPLAPLSKKPIAEKNKNVIARTFDKFNIFAKHKQSTAIANNNQKPGG